MIEFIVYGTPGPQGSKKFVGLSKSGKGLMIESSRKVKPWREEVELAARIAWGRQMPMDGPLTVRMIFTLKKPAAAPKRRRTYPHRLPDLSKLARSTEDAITTAGVWRDDSRVVEYSRLAKVYPGEDPEALDRPGVRVVIASVR